MVSMTALKRVTITLRIGMWIRFGILLLLASATTNALAQEPEAASRPDRGMNPNGTYSISNLDNINLTNGNVTVSLPLASLPPIAGGKLSWTLSATYNSKLWNLKSIDNSPDSFHSTEYTTQRVQRGEQGGWSVSGKYQISQQLADDDVQVQCEAGDQQCLAAMAYRYKMILITPDGRRHELRPLDASAQEYTGVGGQEWREGYYNATPTTANHSMKYYSFDGSYIWAVIKPISSTIAWEFYLRDGTKVTQRTGGRQTISDPNGNNVEIRTETDSAGVITTRFQDPQADREIRYIYDPAGDGTGSVEYQAAYGVWQTITLNFGTQNLQGRVANLGDRVCTTVGDASHPQLTVIDSIDLPATETGIVRKYLFNYNSEEIINNISPPIQYKTSCSASLQSITSASRGWGSLSQITTPTGAIIEYDYSLDGDWYAANDPIIGSREVPGEVIKEKRVKYDSQTDTWKYTILSQSSMVEGPDGSVTSLDFFDHDPRHGGYMGGVTGFSGLVYRTNNSGKIKTEQQWEMKEFNGASHDTPEGRVGFNTVVKAEYTTLFGSGGIPDKMSAKTFTYDFNGNVTSVAEFDWFDPASVQKDGNGVPIAPPNVTPARITTNSYYNAATSAGSSNIYANRALATATPLILNALQETSIGASRTQYFYDSQSLSTPPLEGNLTRISLFKSGSTWIDTNYTHDGYGNRLTATDPNLNRTDYEIDSATHAQPTKITVYPDRLDETKKLTTTIAYDFSTGLEISRIDSNGKMTEISYINQLTSLVDPFGRPGIITTPSVPVRIGSNVSTQQGTLVMRYRDNARQVEVWSDLSSSGDELLKTRTTVDPIGRTILTEKNEGGSSYTIAMETQYKYKPDGTSGYAVFTKNAHRAASELTDGWTRTTQDKLGRVVEVATFSGGSQPPNTGGSYNGRILTAYDGYQTSVTDQENKVRRSLVDGLGRFSQVIEDPAGLNYSTVYSYDGLGNLVLLTQGPATQQQQRSFTYDNLSRLITAKNPEQINSSGTMVDTAYEYDDASNLKKKTNASGTSVTFGYDGLNRVKTKTLSSGEIYTYLYDLSSVANGQGRLASVTRQGGDGYYLDGYDAVGKVTADRQVTEGTTYGLEYGYDLAGNMTWEKYPSGREITTTYDSASRISAINGTKTGESNKLYASQYLYTAHGAVRSVTFGNSVIEQSDYNARLQVTKIEAKKDNVLLLGLDYSYGSSASTNNGNVSGQVIRIGTSFTFSQSYIYDGVNRLQIAQEGTGPVWKQQFDYDRFGNRTFNQATTGNVLGENIAISAASNRITTSGYSYDFSGNLINAPGKIYTYDAENRQRSFTDTSIGTTYDYTYDGDGRRVKKATGSVATVYVYDVLGRLIAEYASDPVSPPAGGGGTSYLTKDSLGSTRMVAKADGSVKARYDFLPYGEEIGASIGGRGGAGGYGGADSTRQKFTGKLRDTESGLDYFEARYYSAAQGRFTSPDDFTGGPDELFDFTRRASDNPTFYANPYNPQSLNKYPYCYNSPLRYIDPDGHDPLEPPEPPEPPQRSKSKGVPIPAPPLTLTREETQGLIDAADAADSWVWQHTKGFRDVTGITKLRQWMGLEPVPAPPPTSTPQTQAEPVAQPEPITMARPIDDPEAKEEGHKGRGRHDKHTKVRSGKKKPPNFKPRVPKRPQDKPPKKADVTPTEAEKDKKKKDDEKPQPVTVPPH